MPWECERESFFPCWNPTWEFSNDRPRESLRDYNRFPIGIFSFKTLPMTIPMGIPTRFAWEWEQKIHSHGNPANNVK